MSNYQQPDFRNPVLQGTGVFVFQTQIPINPGPSVGANPAQSDVRKPNLAGGVIAVQSELPLVPGPGLLPRYVQPGTPQG